MTMSDAKTGLAIEQVPGSPIVRERMPEPCSVVIFGATGDLTSRKLIPALYNLMAEGALPDAFAIIAVGRRQQTTELFRTHLREQTERYSRSLPLDDDKWGRFADAVEYVSGNIGDGGLYSVLRAALERSDRDRGTLGNRVFYFATPPSLFPVILEKLHGAKLVGRRPPGSTPWGRVIIEKPFGRDLESAQELNQLVARHLREHQTFRIDHYLGKETVQNILVLRFANSIFEPLWNRKSIDHVQITAAESIGVEGRGRFYERTGVVRDIVQNHLLQVLALIAMEPPASFDADAIRDEKVKTLRSVRPIGGGELEQRVVFGQYDGYHSEPDVEHDSRTPTYVAMKMLIDNWRWQGVPFYLRAGKGLANKVTEVAVHFQHVPLCLFPQENTCQRLAQNVLTLRIQPDEAISLRFMAKIPGEDLEVSNVLMNMRYEEAFDSKISEAYERLLIDSMRGDATLFARRDGVEQAWRLVAPLLEAHESGDAPAPQRYDHGSAGPAAADDLLLLDGRTWRELILQG